MFDFLQPFLVALKPLSPGIVAAAVFIALILGLRFTLRGQAWTERLRTPMSVLYGYLFCVLAAVGAKVWYSPLYRLLFLISLLVLTLGVVLSLSVALFDLFLHQTRKVQVPAILRDIVVILVYAFVAVVALGNAGVNVSSIITTSAVLTAIVGFALQDLLSSIVSGLAIQMERPFQEGDWVQFGEQKGRVLEINWRSTKIETLHRDVVVIPNNVITRTPVINFSVPDPVHRRRLEIGLRYEAAPNRVRASILKALSEVEGVLASPEPYVVLKQYADFSINYRIYFYIDDFAARERIEDRVLTRIWYQLRRDGLSIPFPIQDINVRTISDEDDARQAEQRRKLILEALSKVHFLEPLSSEELERLAHDIVSEFYATGETIIEQGRPGDSFYIIADGMVEVRVGRPGKQRAVATLKRHDFFGERSLVTGEARSATIVALEDTEVYVVSKDAFKKIISANEQLIEHIGKRLAERAAKVEEAEDTLSDAGSVTTTDQRTLISKIRRFFQL